MPGMDDFAPFTAPLEKALRLKSMVDDIAFKREQREQNRQAFQMHIEDRQRQQMQQDFQTAMTLGQMGAVEATPEVQQGGQVMDQIFGPVTPESKRPLMTAPTGKQYYVPTADQQQDKADDRAITRAGKIKDATDPWTTIDVRGKEMRVRTSQLDNIIPKVNPQWKMDKTVNKQTGDVTKIWSDEQGNEMKRVVEPGMAGQASTAAGKEALPDRTAIEKYMNDWRGTVYSRLGITPEDEAVNKGTYKFPAGMTEAEKAEVRKGVSQRIASAERDLENKAEAQAKADIRSRGEKGGTGQPSTPAFTGKVVTRANAATIARAKGLSLTSWIQQFEAAGGKVQ